MLLKRILNKIPGLYHLFQSSLIWTPIWRSGMNLTHYILYTTMVIYLSHHVTLWPGVRDGRFDSKVGQIRLQIGQIRDFSDQISSSLSQMYWNLIWKSPGFVPFVVQSHPLWSQTYHPCEKIRDLVIISLSPWSDIPVEQGDLTGHWLVL